LINWWKCPKLLKAARRADEIVIEACGGNAARAFSLGRIQRFCSGYVKGATGVEIQPKETEFLDHPLVKLRNEWYDEGFEMGRKESEDERIG